MQVENRLLDDLARVANGAIGALSGVRGEIEAFLATGGEINQVAPHVTADPPQKPSSRYGGQPI